MQKIVYPLLIGCGVGLTGRFLYVGYDTPVKVVGVIASLCILGTGMMLNYKYNRKK